MTATKLAAEGAAELAAWSEFAANNPKQAKKDQDQLDACICLVSALHIAKRRDTLFVGCCTTVTSSFRTPRCCETSLNVGVQSLGANPRAGCVCFGWVQLLSPRWETLDLVFAATYVAHRSCAVHRADAVAADPFDSLGEHWLYELKLDGYRAIAFKRNGDVSLRSCNDNDFNARYPAVVKALGKLSDNAVIDGEIVAFDEEGRPSFNALQNYRSAPAPVVYYVFDVLILSGEDVRREPLQKRRELLEKKVLPKLPEPVRYSAPLDAELPVLMAP